MRGIVLVVGAALVLILLAAWISRKNLLLRIAGVSPDYIQTVPDRVRYSSMGGIVLLTAIAATASLTVALSLVFPHRSWLGFLPVGILWGAVVFNFDRWIVSSLDYGPLTAGDAAPGRRSRSASKVMHFVVRFIMAALVGLVISEPIVLAIFGPEIDQQLTAQHTADIVQQTAQINSAERRQAAALNSPVTAAANALKAATGKANSAHEVYICELTGNCHLPAGEVTGIAGRRTANRPGLRCLAAGPGRAEQCPNVFDTASANGRTAAAALNEPTNQKIKNAAETINADNGLLARERALDTLTRQNPGFLLRRLLLWLALMFIDLAPVLLKTFSPPTLYELLQRSAAIQLGRHAMADAVADSDHESSKKAITREGDLERHRVVTDIEYRSMARTQSGPSERADGAVGPAGMSRGDRARTNSLYGSARGAGKTGAGRGRRGEKTGAGKTGAGKTVDAADPGWVIGHRWHIQRPLSDVPGSGRVPFVAVDLYGQYSFEVVVKIIAPPPGVAGWQALRQRRHAQLEMSLPQGYLHDNIAEVLDCDVDQEHGAYTVTRRYPTTLEQYLGEASEQDALTIGLVLNLAGQILAGLRAAWDRGFVHLDLKPANVALTEDGTVKLIDFGLARQYQKVNGRGDTASAARFTMFYAPPEQMERGDATWISRNADIRALGAVIYRMLTGYPPMFREARALGLVDPSGRWLADEAVAYFDLKELMRSIEPVPVAELIGHVPPDLDTLLRSWLRIDPQMRSPGNPENMAERVWLELAATFERVHASGEADYPVGPQVTQEPEFAQLRAEWHRGSARHPTLWAGTARSGHPGSGDGRGHGAGWFRRSGDNCARGQRCRGDVVAHHESHGRRARQDTR